MGKNIKSLKVTILMPVYNSEKFLREAIDSILNQSFKNFEFIIIDDGSTDSSKEIIETYKDPRIKYFNNKENMGVARTLNRGIRLAKGEYIARMDADDISHSDRLRLQVKFLDQHPNYSLIASKVEVIDNSGKKLGTWVTDLLDIYSNDQIRNQLPISNCLAHPSIIFRSNVIKKYYYNESLRRGIEDYELWLRLVNAGCRIEKMNKILLLYRQKLQMHPSYSLSNIIFTKSDYAESFFN
jgi:glycosyltransferase involved in cell wall biosynthesis